MSSRKRRLTVTVDPELVQAGQSAVESGEAESVSGWVSAALEERVQRDQKLRLLGAAVASFEDEFGEITAEEIAAQQRADREQATVLRARRKGGKGTSRSK